MNRPAHFDVDAARASWREHLETQRAAALRMPQWKGREAELDLQLELGEVLTIVSSKAMQFANDGSVSIGAFSGAVGIMLGSVLHFVSANFGDEAVTVAVKYTNKAIAAGQGGELPEGAIYANQTIKPTVGGNA